RPLHLPKLESEALRIGGRGTVRAGSMGELGKYLAKVVELNAAARNFRIVCPDELESNRLGAVLGVTASQYGWPGPAARGPGGAKGATPLEEADLGFQLPRMGDLVGADGAPMVRVPAGEFVMGSPSSDAAGAPEERTKAGGQHHVTLKAFSIDRFEATDGQYRAFLAAVKKIGHAFCDSSEPPGLDRNPNSTTWSDAAWNGARQPVGGLVRSDAAALCPWPV